MEAVRRRCRIRNALVRESLAELVGTMSLVFIGNSAIANNTLTGVGGVNIPLGYASALAISVFATGGVSGGHLNPAVTLALCLTGRCHWSRLIPFTIVQFIGAFLGAALTHALFFELVQADSSKLVFEGVFSTYPVARMLPDGTMSMVSIAGGILDQTLGTALLLYGIMAITDKRNMAVPKGVIPLAIGLTLFMVITSTGNNTGAAVNPARDLSPRLYSLIIGYDSAFRDGNHFWWIPVVAGYLGAVVGAMFYFFTIEIHHADEGDDDEEEKMKETKAPRPPQTVEGQPGHWEAERPRRHHRYSADDRYDRQYSGRENLAYDDREERSQRF